MSMISQGNQRPLSLLFITISLQSSAPSNIFLWYVLNDGCVMFLVMYYLPS